MTTRSEIVFATLVRASSDASTPLCRSVCFMAFLTVRFDAASPMALATCFRFSIEACSPNISAAPLRKPKPSASASDAPRSLAERMAEFAAAPESISSALLPMPLVSRCSVVRPLAASAALSAVLAALNTLPTMPVALDAPPAVRKSAMLMPVLYRNEPTSLMFLDTAALMFSPEYARGELL